MRRHNRLLLLCLAVSPVWANSPPNVVVSNLSGSSAAGVQQVFSFTYSDPDGAADIDAATAAFWSTPGTGCRVTYEFGAFYLANDNGTALLGPIYPNAGTLSNSYCTLTNPSVSNSGTQRTLTLPLTFTSASAGTLSHYKYVSDWAGLNSGYVWDGSWTVTNGNQAPTFVSSYLSGASTAGVQQVFTFTYSDPNGVSDIDAATAAFSTTPGTGCRVTYEFGLFWLANDNGTALLGPIYPNAGTLANGYCTLTNPAVSDSGTQRTLTLPLTFTAAAVGTLSHYKYVSDWAGLNTGYVWDGSWNVVGNTLTQTITTNPAGLALSVDGAPCTAPCTFHWAANSYHTIATTSPQAGASGSQFVFSNWSDGGGMSHTIQAPGSSATWTANLARQYYLTTAASPSGGGTVSPSSGWYYEGITVPVTAVANAGYQFFGFSGAVTGGSPAYVTMNSNKSVTANFTAGIQHVIKSKADGDWVNGVSVTVDGASCTTPCTYSWAPGSNHTVAVAFKRQINGNPYHFSHLSGDGVRQNEETWSDSALLTTPVTAQPTLATYVVNVISDAVAALTSCLNQSTSRFGRVKSRV